MVEVRNRLQHPLDLDDRITIQSFEWWGGRTCTLVVLTIAYTYANFCTHLDRLLNLQSMNLHGRSRTSVLQEYSKNLWVMSPFRKSWTNMFRRFRPPTGSTISTVAGQHSTALPSVPVADDSLCRRYSISRSVIRLFSIPSSVLQIMTENVSPSLDRISRSSCPFPFRAYFPLDFPR